MALTVKLTHWDLITEQVRLSLSVVPSCARLKSLQMPLWTSTLAVGCTRPAANTSTESLSARIWDMAQMRHAPDITSSCLGTT